MKLMLIISFFFSCFAQAATVEGPSLAPAATDSIRRFHWITYHCSVEEGDEIETTPGSPPMNIDDPATPGCRNWEINIVVDGDLSKDEKNYQLPLVDINYGIGDNLQLKYEVPNIVTTMPESRISLVGPSKAGVKYQFYGNDESKLQIAVYPQIQFSTPGTSAHSEIPESRGTITSIPFLLAKRIGRTSRGNVMMTANLGYSYSSRDDTANAISAALGFGAPLVGKTSIMIELATEQATAKIAQDAREHVIKVDVGALGPIGRNFMLFGSLGRSLVASDDKAHNYFVSGIRVLLGN